MTDDEKSRTASSAASDEAFLAECEERIRHLEIDVDNDGGWINGIVERLIAMVRERDAKIRDLHLRFQLEVKLPKNLAFDMADARISTLESALREVDKKLEFYEGLTVENLPDREVPDRGVRVETNGVHVLHIYPNEKWESAGDRARAAREKIKEVLG